MGAQHPFPAKSNARITNQLNSTMFRPKDGHFAITSVHRDDLETQGFDASNIDDATMFELAHKMANAYVESDFWIDLEIIAEHIGIPKKAE
jgi:hypothetical protein